MRLCVYSHVRTFAVNCCIRVCICVWFSGFVSLCYLVCVGVLCSVFGLCARCGVLCFLRVQSFVCVICVCDGAIICVLKYLDVYVCMYVGVCLCLSG